MKIGFDISQTAFIGGVATYTKELAKALSLRKDLEIVFFYTSLRKPYKGELANVKSLPIPPSLFQPVMNNWRFINIEQFIGKVDVFHSSDWVQPASSAKKVTTYHDVIPLKYPQWSVPSIIKVHKERLEKVEREIDYIIAVSESTKQDLLELTHIPAEKIEVIYEGVSENFKPQSESTKDEFRKKYNLPKEFVLAISGVGERRNLARVKDAVGDLPLVVSGELMPRPSDSQMPVLYSLAKVLLYPSLYEGFGLPVLESFACGVPVITSNVSALPEVGGDGACYVDPLNVDEITAKLKEVWADVDLRKELIAKGFKQVQKFSWQKSADTTVALYERLNDKQ
ncbi:hypothetical protein A2631_02740 [Candidatus Daviesbacteria bacterium RIFCSPHIGHO2_01_FULL_44_29]|uniref:Glycosyl transferase family 1 domain-containing protein n=1 Tax=Candidatus Daviesbacteria bacterium RIFCSPHIGHO2_02_FULL_43_12 TaxID=1797776 RepID=A0A1F5KL02_9BACT|nr:MAG: hypothetical protein A2631_02740 [Candidatus Daviesbacteria bacterium RIFCSPHIGHO2_01_FULL_44_29]OGE40844.1 MAG: hypothetical protein A3E86_02610 [Candidatus Daviesbacteria bacterium RIFCSPHIGHO2_12_FULL_47_45]OGE41301.1 MAG: hypothetical protein A3D25_02135 [Candidatus Daviesbacteria bacterium RIFCSPHIGHO2_02_FULL_43_12]OGE69502.1 MAG: hypothetical protein A3B55_03875 [Candidatus Daviesbacteria bacterium RIFCSPLOWO2_01_FULL_43_15]